MPKTIAWAVLIRRPDEKKYSNVVIGGGTPYFRNITDAYVEAEKQKALGCGVIVVPVKNVGVRFSKSKRRFAQRLMTVILSLGFVASIASGSWFLASTIFLVGLPFWAWASWRLE